MEPTEALRSIEIALRLAIRSALGTPWPQSNGAPNTSQLQRRQTQEAERRPGAVVSVDLLDYADFNDLSEMIRLNWRTFEPVFRDEQQTGALLEIVRGIRNNIAHSRELVPFEQHLLSGIAGRIRNQVSLYRSRQAHPSAEYYPLIESLTDGFGNQPQEVKILGRLEVGDTITFTGTAFNATGRAVKWFIQRDLPVYDPEKLTEQWLVAEGDSVTFDYVVTESDIGESCMVEISITTDSRYHRHGFYDDSRELAYAVNPPHE